MAKNVSTGGSSRRSPGCIELIPIPGLPEIREGDDLPGVIFAAARKARIGFQNTDIVVVAQKAHPVLIVETHHGFVCANAGVDHSNVPGEDVVTLLPTDPDRSARLLAAALRRLTRKRVAVVISDTFGRPWRLGLTNVAVGAAGVPVLLDLRGTRDRNSKPLQATILAIADDLGAAAGLVMGKREGIPAVIIRGYKYRAAQEPATKIIRPAREDLFR